MRIDPQLSAASLPRRPLAAPKAAVRPQPAEPAGRPQATKAPGPVRTASAPATVAPPPKVRTTLAGDGSTPNVSIPGSPEGPATTAAATGPAGAPLPPGLTLEGLQRAWGQSDSPYDLNGDRTVDVDDLIQFLMSQAAPQPELAPPAPDDAAAAEPLAEVRPELANPEGAAAEAGPTDPQGLLAGVRKDWGETDSPFDVNNDSTVDVDDLISVILNWPTNQMAATATAPAVPEDGKTGTAGPVAAPTLAGDPAPPRAETLTAALLERLARTGHEHRLPANLDQLLDRLDADDRERNAVAKALHARYPGGLGLNVVG